MFAGGRPAAPTTTTAAKPAAAAPTTAAAAPTTGAAPTAAAKPTAAAAAAPQPTTAAPAAVAANANAAARPASGALPSYIPNTSGPKPEFPSSGPLYEDGYSTYPTNPTRANPETPPGSGSKVDIFTTAFLPLPPNPVIRIRRGRKSTNS